MATKQTGISDDAVIKATGKNWRSWFSQIDKKGGKQSTHKKIVAIIKLLDSGVSGWWRQMIAVTYEQARGLREKHEMSDGFQVTVSRTLPYPIGRLYQGWKLKRNRDKWYPDMPISISRANVNKNLRMKWIDDDSRLEIQFIKKDTSKTQIVIQHRKIKTAKKAESKKKFWQNQMVTYKAYLSAN